MNGHALSLALLGLGLALTPPATPLAAAPHGRPAPLRQDRRMPIPEGQEILARDFLRRLEASLPDARSPEGRLLLHLKGEGDLFHALAGCLADPADELARRRWGELCKREGLWSWVSLEARRAGGREPRAVRWTVLRALAAWKDGRADEGLRLVERALGEEPWNRRLHRARCKLRRSLAPDDPRPPVGDLATFRRAARREWALRRAERIARALRRLERDRPASSSLALGPGREQAVLAELVRAGGLPAEALTWKGPWASGPSREDGRTVVVDLRHGLRGRSLEGEELREPWPLHRPSERLLHEALQDGEEAVAALAAEALLRPGRIVASATMERLMRRVAGWSAEGRDVALCALIGLLRCQGGHDGELALALRALERDGAPRQRALARWARAWAEGSLAGRGAATASSETATADPLPAELRRLLAGPPMLPGERWAPDQWALAVGSQKDGTSRLPRKR